jgi:hypothetical protein
MPLDPTPNLSMIDRRKENINSWHSSPTLTREVWKMGTIYTCTLFSHLPGSSIPIVHHSYNNRGYKRVVAEETVPFQSHLDWRWSGPDIPHKQSLALTHALNTVHCEGSLVQLNYWRSSGAWRVIKKISSAVYIKQENSIDPCFTPEPSPS